MQTIIIPEINPSGRNLSIDRFFTWKIDFEFLMSKADRELEKIYSEGIYYFPQNVINFSITLDGLCDYVWHTIIKYDRNHVWKTNEKSYKEWLVKQHLYLSVFVDLSNNFKHFDRSKPNICLRGLASMFFQEDSPYLDDIDEENNVIRFDGTQKGKPVKLIYSPRVSITKERYSLPFRSVAHGALKWWKDYYASII